jgi:hypothetical protein
MSCSEVGKLKYGLCRRNDVGKDIILISKVGKVAIPVSKLRKYFVVDKLIYHSIDLSLYQVSAIIDGVEHYISDERGKLLRSTNLIELQKLLRQVAAEKTVLRHTSAYDEMIGGPQKGESNALEVPLADNQLY